MLNNALTQCCLVLYLVSPLPISVAARPAQSVDQAALQELAVRYVTTLAHRDIARVTSFWDGRSPNLPGRLKEIATFLAGHDQIEVSRVTAGAASSLEDRQRLRVSFN